MAENVAKGCFTAAPGSRCWGGPSLPHSRLAADPSETPPNLWKGLGCCWKGRGGRGRYVAGKRETLQVIDSHLFCPLNTTSSLWRFITSVRGFHAAIAKPSKNNSFSARCEPGANVKYSCGSSLNDVAIGTQLQHTRQKAGNVKLWINESGGAVYYPAIVNLLLPPFCMTTPKRSPL